MAEDSVRFQALRLRELGFISLMLHQDASRHAWLSDGPALDLVVTMDVATSEIYSAFLVEEEGTDSNSIRTPCRASVRRILPTSRLAGRYRTDRVLPKPVISCATDIAFGRGW